MTHHASRLAPAAVALVGVVLAGPAPASGEAAPVTCRGELATIVGTSGSDDLAGTPGRDVIAGLGGRDTIRGNGGDDLVCGGGGADVLEGDAGDDRLHGGADTYGEDQGGTFLRGDTLRGGPGDDLLDVGLDGRRVDGYRRPDAVVFDRAAAGVVVDLSGDEGVATGEGVDRIVVTAAMGVTGSAYDDSITGSPGEDWLVGGAGDDVLVAGRGRDRVYPDALTAVPGDDVVRAGPGADLVVSFAGHDDLRGGSGRDWIDAQGSGADRIHAGAGGDVVSQWIVGETGLASDGGRGLDHLALVGDGVEGTTPRPVLTLDLRDGTTSLDTDPAATGTAGGYEEYRLLGDLAWVFHGTPGRDRVWAVEGGPLDARTYAGDDWMQGTARDDRLDGGEGIDEVHGLGGQDTCIDWEVGSC